MPPAKCGSKDLFKEIIEYLRYKAVKAIVLNVKSDFQIRRSRTNKTNSG